MARFMLEINHPSEHAGCVRALHAIAQHGSHLVTHAEHGCGDGVHSGWLVVEAESRDEAARLIPPGYRAEARVVELRTWTKEEILEMMQRLEAREASESV